MSNSHFVQFWARYPKRTGRKAALQLWEMLSPNAELAQRIIDGAERYGRHVAGWKAQYVAGATKWLEGARWEDELPKSPTDEPDPILSIYEACHHEPQCTSWGQHDIRQRLDSGKRKP